MKRLLIVCLFVCGFAYAQTRDQLALLNHEIERIIHRGDKTASVGVEVVSLATGRRLYSKNGDQRFIPASLSKILTLGAALEVLGVNYQYQTCIFTDGNVENGVLFGNLYLKGSGDPQLSVENLSQMAKHIRVMGIREVRGSVIVDASVFDSVNKGPGWMWEDANTTWNGVVSALTVNESCIDLWVQPANADSAPAQIVTDIPMMELPFDIDNQTLTLNAEKIAKPLFICPGQKSDKKVMQISGNVAMHALAQKHRVPVEKPALMAGAALQAILKQYGIHCTGTLHEGVVPAHGVLLTAYQSPPLNVIAQKMVKNSDNLYAHLILKTLGLAEKGAPGSWQSGSQVVRAFLSERAKMDISNLVFVDASGLSRYNLISPKQMVDYLWWIHHQSLYTHEFKAALSIAGVDGTLQDRLTQIRGRLRGKTGTMTGVSSLCGYVTTADNEELAFVIMVNGTVKEQSQICSAIIDPICLLLANFSLQG